jgi:ABC-type transporter Mla subunit MlaD
VEESEKSLKNLVATLSQASESANNVVTTQQENLEASIENVRVTTENLRELTENLKAQPSQLLFGEPPARSKPGGE